MRLPFSPATSREAGERGEPAGQQRGPEQHAVDRDAGEGAPRCGSRRPRASRSRAWCVCMTTQTDERGDQTEPEAPVEPQARRRCAAAAPRETSGADCGQPSAIGSFIGPSSSMETNSSMMKLSSSVVTTSSTPKRILSTAGPSRSSAPGQRRRQRRSPAAAKAGQPQRAGAEHDGRRQRAGVELRLGPDVPELGAEGDGDGEAGEDQRRRAVQRLEDRELRAGRARSRSARSTDSGSAPASARQQRCRRRASRRAPRPAGPAAAPAKGRAIGSSRMRRLGEALPGHPAAEFGLADGPAREAWREAALRS